jgi:hypothetical protein
VLPASVARYIFNPKIPIWINFEKSCNGRCQYFCGHLVYFTVKWYISWTFGKFSGNLVYFPVKWYISWTFGKFCGHLVFFSRFGNPATNQFDKKADAAIGQQVASKSPEMKITFGPRVSVQPCSYCRVDVV